MKKNTPKRKTLEKIAGKARKNPFKAPASETPKVRTYREEIPEKEKRETIDEIATENDTGCVILENCSYPTGLIGWTFDDDGKMRAVYSEERMIEDLMTEEKMSYGDAVEYFEYNTLRGLPYCKTDECPPPIIIHTFN